MMNSVDKKYYDVIICGSGPAGLGAALSSKRENRNVILLESANLLGGTINAVPFMPINRLEFEGNEKRSYAHAMLVKHLKALGEESCYSGKVDFINGGGYSCHVECSEVAIYNMLEEAEIDYRMFSPVRNVIMEDNVVKGVIVAEKRGPVAYYADVVVDTTGDGDVAAAAGCDFVLGREDDGVHMPITLGFALGGIVWDEFFPWLEANRKGGVLASDGIGEWQRIMDDADSKGYYVAAWYDFNHGTAVGVVGVNNGAWRHQSLFSNAIDAADLTKARCNGMRVALDLPKILKAYHVPGTEKAYLDKVGNILGVRDTRRIVCEYMQTFEDSQSPDDLPDTVARKYGWIDGNQVFQGPMHSGYGFPYRSLVPLKIDNLLVAGRCAGMTFMGHIAGKSMGNMMELGIAAGTAAAMCSRSKITPRNLKIDELRKELIQTQEVKL